MPIRCTLSVINEDGSREIKMKFDCGRYFHDHFFINIIVHYILLKAQILCRVFGLGLSPLNNNDITLTHQLQLLLVFQDQDVKELLWPDSDETMTNHLTRVGKKVQHLTLQIAFTQAV